MKILYNHLIKHIPSKPSISEVSEKLFQLGHENEILDNIIDLEITPNRGDCLSLNGITRELGAFYDLDVNNNIYTDKIDNDLNLNFKNNAPDSCPNISFLKIDISKNTSDYKGYLKSYFSDLNNKKNNFFADISNYILYETGQPSHCYDSDKLGQNFLLEKYQGSYEFTTLHNEKIELKGSNLVFKKDKEIINLAGIIGGKNTACSKNTNSVIVEFAYFKKEEIIGKAVQYNINSDAAYRFERGVDPDCHNHAIRRFLAIVDEHADIQNIQIYNKNNIPARKNDLNFNVEGINKILGISISEDKYKQYLLNLGFHIKDNLITVPTFRHDINSQNDLAEEIARLIGYNNIPTQNFPLKLKALDKQIVHQDSDLLEAKIKSYLSDCGFYEVINNPFVDKQLPNAIKIDNPLDSNKKYLRLSTRESLLNNLLYNERRQKDSIKLFEISNIYSSQTKIQSTKVLGIICSGRVDRNYIDFSKKIDKKYIINVLKEILPDCNLHPEVISRLNINTKNKNQILFVEIELDAFNLDNLRDINESKHKLDKFINYRPISEYPISFRDLSFSVGNYDDYNNLQDVISKFNNKILKDVFIFDFYKDSNNQLIKIGFRFIFQSNYSTITDIEISEVMDNLIKLTTSINTVEIPGLYK